MSKSFSGRKSPLKGIKRPDFTGKNHPNWKGGISGVNKLERSRFRREIQKLVFIRDDYTCQICNERGGNLQVDHIQSWKDYVDLRFDMKNCRTLCMECNYQITFRRGKPKNLVSWGHNLKHVIDFV